MVDLEKKRKCISSVWEVFLGHTNLTSILCDNSRLASYIVLTCGYLINLLVAPEGQCLHPLVILFRIL